MSRARAVASFHVRAGARAALRASAVGVAGVIFVLGSAPEPARTLMTLVLGAVGTRPSPASRIGVAAFALALAAVAARRVTLGAATWMRTLPVSARDARRGAWLACTFATLPVALFAVAAVALAPTLYHAALSAPRILTVPPLLLAAGAAALRSERRLVRPLALAALAALAWGTWPGLTVGVALLALWDRTAGGVRAAALTVRARRPSARAPSGMPSRMRAGAIALGWTARAVGVRAAADALLAAVLPIGFAALVRANNPELGDDARATAVRVGANVAVALAASSLAGPLLARRPPWPWARSLPWSARTRVLLDALAVAAPLLVVAAGGLALPALRGEGVSWRDVAAALATVVVAATGTASALRVGAHRQTGAVGESFLVAGGAAVALAIVPALSAAAPVAAAALVLHGARRDRRAADVVRWNELRHDVRGDQGWIARA